jgi:biotin carboxyl carrier protein
MMDKKYKVRLHGSEFDLEQSKKGIKVNNHYFKPEVRFNGRFYRVFVNGRVLKVEFRDNDILLDGKIVDFDFKAAPQIQTVKGSSHRKSADIKAAIPGKIVEIKVKVGDEITDQQCLLVLESMKMRNEILSPMVGVIDSISVNVGDQVKSRQLLIKIKRK